MGGREGRPGAACTEAMHRHRRGAGESSLLSKDTLELIPQVYGLFAASFLEQ